MGINAGDHEARAVSATLTETKAGDTQVAVNLSFGDTQAAGGSGITWFGGFKTEKAEAKTLDTLRTCGWRGDDLADLSSIDGSEIVKVVVEADEYNGKTTMKAKWINRIGSNAKRLDSAKARTFADKMKARVHANNTKDFGPTPSREEPPPHGDRDVPPPGFEEEPF